MGYIQLRKKLETLPINSSFPSTLVFTQTSICPFKKKKSWGETIIANSDLPLMADDGDLLIEPEVILDTRWVKQRSIFIEESLVQCKRLPVDYATWENSQELCDKFININLKDKVSVTGGSIDKPKRSLRVLVKNPKYLD
jgi:hypothetical protein